MAVFVGVCGRGRLCECACVYQALVRQGNSLTEGARRQPQAALGPVGGCVDSV